MSSYPQITCKNLTIGKNFTIAPTAHIEASHLEIGDDVQIQDGVSIKADTVRIDSLSIIEQGNHFHVKKLDIGYKVKIEQGGQFRAIGSTANLFSFGDFCFVGATQNVLVPEFKLGDYTAIHNSLLVNGYKPCVLGHNCWVGQDTILNSTESLTIGNNVRIGTQSQLWTHVASGELLEGCTLFGQHPLVLEDNVWIVGGAVISPGLIVKNASVIMVGAVLTKSTEPRHCYAGVPAKDVTDKIKVYRDIAPAEKSDMMAKFVDEFHGLSNNSFRNQVFLAESREKLPKLDSQKESVVILSQGEVIDLGPLVSCFSLETKHYTKRRTTLEERFIRFHLGYRARFLPL